MSNLTVTLTGRLGDDPRTFATRNDAIPGVELRLAVEIPAPTDGESVTRWFKVSAYGALASRVAASVRKGDRVTVIADDLRAEAWTGRDDGKAHGGITVRAREIAASMAYDTLTTGYADRKAARAAAADGQPSDLPAGEQADAQVLAGVTRS